MDLAGGNDPDDDRREEDVSTLSLPQLSGTIILLTLLQLFSVGRWSILGSIYGSFNYPVGL